MSFKIILKQIAEYPLLSHEEIVKLSVDLKRHEDDAWRQADQPREDDFLGERIRELGRSSAKVKAHLFHADRCVDALTRGNLRLVAKYAIAYGKRVQHLDLEDLFQEGSLGLLCAIRRFKPQLGYKFSTYATWWIQHYIGRAIADKERIVRVPVHIIESNPKVVRARRALFNELGRAPSVDELAKRVGISAKKLQRVLDAMSSQISLDQQLDEGPDTSLYNLLSDPDAESAFDACARSEIALQMIELLDELPPVQQMVLVQRFGFGAEEKTLAEIGEDRQLSRERIRQIEKVALDNLRELFEGGSPKRQRTRRCARCGKVGHNRQSCDRPVN
jgi:RNA polymerase primary sigma factor